MRPGILYTWPIIRYSENTAIVFKEQRLSYKEMDALINRLSNGLLSLGLKTGDKVAAILANRIESAAAIIAIPRAGLTYVSLNARNSPQEQAETLNDSETDALILGQEFVAAMQPGNTGTAMKL